MTEPTKPVKKATAPRVARQTTKPVQTPTPPTLTPTTVAPTTPTLVPIVATTTDESSVKPTAVSPSVVESTDHESPLPRRARKPAQIIIVNPHSRPVPGETQLQRAEREARS